MLSETVATAKKAIVWTWDNYNFGIDLNFRHIIFFVMSQAHGFILGKS